MANEISEYINERIFLYNDNNYLTNIVGNGDVCYVFITSNGVFDDYRKLSKNQIKDKFEWRNIAKNKKILRLSGKHIFIRDVYSLFYVYGINKKINSIYKLVEFLKIETKGYKVIFVGSSAGAYLAILLSSFLGNSVEKVFAFGAIFDLRIWRGAFNQYSNDRISFFENLSENHYPFISLLSLCFHSQIPVFYFYGEKNYADIQQFNLFKTFKLPFFSIGLNTDKHCGNCSYYLYVLLLTSKAERLESFFHKHNCNLKQSKLLFHFSKLQYCRWLANRFFNKLRRLF